MYPDLLKIPFFSELYIHSYGMMVAIGFLMGSVWVYFESRRLGENPDKGLDLIFYILVAAILGSRVVYVLVNEREEFLRNPLIIFKFWVGLVFYGGVFGALLVGGLYMRKHKMNFWKQVDIFAPAIPLGHFFGRIGCTLAGCCYGKPVLEPHWWTIIFPEHRHAVAPVGVPLYPTQLIEASLNLLIFLGLVIFRKHKRFEGQVFLTYLIIYGIVRSLIEELRGDAARGFVFGLVSTSQFVSILLILLAVIFYIVRWKKK